MRAWLLAAAVAAQPVAPLVVPVERACVTSPFGPRVLAGQPQAGTFHHGVDLRAPAGGAVRAVADGRVLSIDRRGAGGLEVLVRHAGFDALYAHLGRLAPAFAEGRREVRAGEALGVIGRTGLTYGTHLYFELHVGGARVDPAPALRVVACAG